MPAPAPEPILAVDPVVTQIVVRPEHLDLANGSGVVVEELSYDAEAEEFVDTLADVLGGPADVEERPWRPRVASVDELHVARRRASATTTSRPGYSVRHERDGAVHASGRRQRHHGVDASQGFRPGDDLESFADELGEDWHGERLSTTFPCGDWARTSARSATTSGTTPTGMYEPNAYAVVVSAAGTSGTDPAVTSVILSTLELRHRSRVDRGAAIARREVGVTRP